MSLDTMDIRKRVGGIEYDLKALLDEIDALKRDHDRQVARLVARIAELEAERAVAARVPR
jgi:hypothetical protein